MFAFATPDLVNTALWFFGVTLVACGGLWLLGRLWDRLTGTDQQDYSGAAVTLMHARREATPADWRQAAEASLARSRRRRGLEPHA